MSDELHAEYREGRSDAEAERFWEDHYRRRGRVWSGRPNPVLVDVVGSLRPGTALDLGCGEGGDAIWLARQGWRVTAVDVSATALDRAAADAATAGVADRIDFRQHDQAFERGLFTVDLDLNVWVDPDKASQSPWANAHLLPHQGQQLRAGIFGPSKQALLQHWERTSSYPA